MDNFGQFFPANLDSYGILVLYTLGSAALAKRIATTLGSIAYLCSDKYTANEACAPIRDTALLLIFIMTICLATLGKVAETGSMESIMFGLPVAGFYFGLWATVLIYEARRPVEA